MELNIIKLLKQLRNQVRRKPTSIVVKLPEIKPTKSNKKPTKSKREQITAVVNGRELSLKDIAKFYGLHLKTVQARYRVGNRGKLLVRPSMRKST